MPTRTELLSLGLLALMMLAGLAAGATALAHATKLTLAVQEPVQTFARV